MILCLYWKFSKHCCIKKNATISLCWFQPQPSSKSVCICSLPEACCTLDQWFLTSFTYLTFYQTRLPDLPPLHSRMVIYWKYETNKLLQFGMICKNLHLLQCLVQEIYPFGRWNLSPGVNLPQVKIHCLGPWAVVTAQMTENCFLIQLIKFRGKGQKKSIEKSSFLQVLAAVVIGAVGPHVALNDLH